MSSCASCGKPSRKLCGRCLLVSYCDEGCQIDHFPVHRIACRKLREIAVEVLEEVIETKRPSVGADTDPTPPLAKRQRTAEDAARALGGNPTLVASLRNFSKVDAVRTVAMLLGRHPRAGARSAIGRAEVPTDVLRTIAEFARGDPAYVEEIYDFDGNRAGDQPKFVVRRAPSGDVVLDLGKQPGRHLGWNFRVPYEGTFVWTRRGTTRIVTATRSGTTKTEELRFDAPVAVVPNHFAIVDNTDTYRTEVHIRTRDDPNPKKAIVNGFALDRMIPFDGKFLVNAIDGIVSIDPAEPHPVPRRVVAFDDNGVALRTLPRDGSTCNSAGMILGLVGHDDRPWVARFMMTKEGGEMWFAVHAMKLRSVEKTVVVGGMFVDWEESTVHVPLAREPEIASHALGPNVARFKTSIHEVFDDTACVFDMDRENKTKTARWLTRHNDGSITETRTVLPLVPTVPFGIHKELGIVGVFVGSDTWTIDAKTDNAVLSKRSGKWEHHPHPIMSQLF